MRLEFRNRKFRKDFKFFFRPNQNFDYLKSKYSRISTLAIFGDLLEFFENFKYPGQIIIQISKNRIY